MRIDRFSEEERSRVMRAVGQVDTEPELLLRATLWRTGLRYRLHRRVGRTRPDLVFLGPKVAVFVDGCFWHGCPRHYTAPVHNARFWREKLERNVARDRRNDRDLGNAGWTVVRVWECEIRRELDRVVNAIRMTVRSPAQGGLGSSCSRDRHHGETRPGN